MPTIAEFTTLFDAIGTSSGPDCDIGVALKSAEGWVNQNGDDSAADSSGLAVLPQEVFPSAGTVWVVRTEMWTAASYTEPFGVVQLSYGSDCVYLERPTNVTSHFYSVRCVAD